MSKDEPEFAVGFAEKENDSAARGEKKRVYLDGKLIVYLDSAGNVGGQSFD